MIEVKSSGELEAMRAAGTVVAQTLTSIQFAAQPGTSTAELDELAEQTIRDAGAVPSFKGYYGFPASICTSVNEQVVHGIPVEKPVLRSGDLLSVDCGAILDGWHGDAAVTIEIGDVSSTDQALSSATRTAMTAGIQAMVPGGRLTDISDAIETEALRIAAENGKDYGMVLDYGGHGIGQQMHMDPFVPNAGRRGKGPTLRSGVTLAIEPMLTAGSGETLQLEDGWTVVTEDGSKSAHWEHTVAITDDGPWILTAPRDAGSENHV